MALLRLQGIKGWRCGYGGFCGRGGSSLLQFLVEEEEQARERGRKRMSVREGRLLGFHLRPSTMCCLGDAQKREN